MEKFLSVGDIENINIDIYAITLGEWKAQTVYTDGRHQKYFTINEVVTNSVVMYVHRACPYQDVLKTVKKQHGKLVLERKALLAA